MIGERPREVNCPECGGKWFRALVPSTLREATENHPIYGYVKPCPNPIHSQDHD